MPVFESTSAGLRPLPQPPSGGHAAGIGLRPEWMDSSSLGRPPQAPVRDAWPYSRRASQESRANLLRCFLPDVPEDAA